MAVEYTLDAIFMGKIKMFWRKMLKIFRKSRFNIDDDKSRIQDQMRQSLEALALDAKSQIKLHEGAAVADELALDFDAIYQAYVFNVETSSSVELLKILKNIDEKLTDMSRGGEDFADGLWSDQALYDNDKWHELRKLASDALKLMK